MPDSNEVADFEPLGDSNTGSEEVESGDGHHEITSAKPRGWKKWLRRIAISCLVVVVLLVGGAFLLLRLASVEPEFYTQALSVDPALQKKYGSQMEAKLLGLRNSVIGSDAWSANFSEDEINGWLAWDMQQKFPGLLPPEINDPRIMLGEKSLTLAFRCDVKPFRGVAIVEADVFMTGVVNQLGIRIKSIRSGMVPIPLAVLADHISDQAAKSNLRLEWLTDEGDPVAIVDLPDELIRPTGDLLEVQKLEISKKQLQLAGITHPQDF